MKPTQEQERKTSKKRVRDDLRFRIAYTKPELSLVLPFGHTTLEELIKKGAFPEGLRPHPTAHRIWPRAVIEAWLEKVHSQTPASAPRARSRSVNEGVPE